MSVHNYRSAKRKRRWSFFQRSDFLAAVGIVIPIIALGGALMRDRNSAEEDYTYRNCAEARAAGAAPIHIGQPGYAPHLDADGDGIACEPWSGRSRLIGR
jgi:hypothetical protein